MAKMLIYVTRDNKANSYGQPFTQQTPTHAIRAFRTEVNRQDATNMAYLYPDEFDLMQVGEYDQETGVITALEKPELIINGTQLKAKT